MSQMDRIKTEFRSRILSETANEIRNKQAQIAADWSLFATGELARSLISRHFTVSDTVSGGRLDMNYLSYVRFLDIPNANRRGATPKRKGYALYNRVVFGYLYNNTLPKLKYGYTDEVKAAISAELLNAVTPIDNG
jgi:hypothetical protein